MSGELMKRGRQGFRTLEQYHSFLMFEEITYSAINSSHLVAVQPT
jgi:hypothetical protein